MLLVIYKNKQTNHSISFNKQDVPVLLMSGSTNKSCGLIECEYSQNTDPGF